VGAYAEVVDEEDAVALRIEPLDHVAAHEAASAGYEVCSHVAKMGEEVDCASVHRSMANSWPPSITGR
jgi:uncharacterized membrane protein